MDTNKKNEWVEDVLGSIDGLSRAVPADGVYDNIGTRIRQPLTKGKVISLSIVSAAAACVLLLLAINIYSVVHKDSNAYGKENAARAVVQYYNITNDKELGGL